MRRSTSHRRLAGVALAAGALLAAGCAGAPAPTPDATPAVTLSISAENSVFDRDRLTVPADVPFAIDFENRDVVPHNVSIRGDGVRQVGEIFGGPDERTYTFAALTPGTYTFLCDVHPEMRGTVEVAPGAAAGP